MQYSIGVEYGLHCLIYLIDTPPDSTIGIKELSAFQGVPRPIFQRFLVN